ncbi:MAG: tetratricopeptide repeat protein, partial [Planctomycetales bacterium]|nr:tetratricopeptide repeat protein [Planctomycetales bacterium]
MANVLMGYFYMLMGVRPLVPRAQKSLQAAREDQATVTARERGHMDALDAWSRNDLRGATAHWEAVLLDHPRDVLAAKLAHFGHFYLGAPLQIRDSIARVLPAWSEADPAYGFILSMYAFGLEETG